MKKLTKVGLALLLGLVICLVSGTSGAFAQSANRSKLAVASREMHSDLVRFWHNGRELRNCTVGLCHHWSGATQCVRVLKMVKVWSTRHVMETFKTLHSYKTVVVLHTDWGTRRMVKEVKTWQVRHAMKAIRALRVSRQVIQECHA
ncbi:MAG TPA: hypothetical protein VGF67_11750 [Ktedonobacteraceae bacterium]